MGGVRLKPLIGVKKGYNLISTPKLSDAIPFNADKDMSSQGWPSDN